jgi:hypothetical protein
MDKEILKIRFLLKKYLDYLKKLKIKPPPIPRPTRNENSKQLLIIFNDWLGKTRILIEDRLTLLKKKN